MLIGEKSREMPEGISLDAERRLEIVEPLNKHLSLAMRSHGDVFINPLAIKPA
jgi:hypothetical protein